MNGISRLFIGLLIVTHFPAFGWGRRGHSIVCQTAAYLVAREPKADFMKNHSFDLGYYCNVPDFVWKDPSTYGEEFYNHFMDLEIFDRATKGSSVKNPFELDRKTFDKTFPQVPNKAGRAWWRIKEIFEQITDLKKKLEPKGLKKEEQHAMQADWMVRMGVMGHYVGDLSMPMHVTENHDGQFTKQKGLHAFFEENMVNEMFHDGFDLESEVNKAAEARWKKEKAGLAKKTVQQVLDEQTSESLKVLPELLKIDRQVGRDVKKGKAAYKKMLIERLAAGAVYTAEFFRRSVGYDFNDERFFIWYGSPKFIPNPK